MTLMYESAIIEALQTAIIAAVGNSPALKCINRNFDPPSDGKWWEIVHIPNNVENELWADGKTFQGIMRLILHWPQDDSGAYRAVNEAQRVANQLKKGNVYADANNLVVVKIQDHPNLTGSIEQSPSFMLPLTLRYSCFKI